MKKIIILMLIILSACTLTQSDDVKDVSDQIVCIDIYEPVCCDNVDYPNSCYATEANAVNCIDGQCPEEECIKGEKICTKEYNPYCCEGIEYNNYCMAMNNCAKNCVKGECSTFDETKIPDCVPNQFMCTMEYDPVCCNNETFSNACVAKNNCKINCVKGVCE